jgi:hypothetical protein
MEGPVAAFPFLNGQKPPADRDTAISCGCVHPVQALKRTCLPSGPATKTSFLPGDSERPTEGQKVHGLGRLTPSDRKIPSVESARLGGKLVVRSEQCRRLLSRDRLWLRRGHDHMVRVREARPGRCF